MFYTLSHFSDDVDAVKALDRFGNLLLFADKDVLKPMVIRSTYNKQ